MSRRPDEMYLIRDSGGKMRTIVAASHKGAIKKYLEKYDPDDGEVLDVKRRGQPGGWQSFKVSG